MPNEIVDVEEGTLPWRDHGRGESLIGWFGSGDDSLIEDVHPGCAEHLDYARHDTDHVEALGGEEGNNAAVWSWKRKTDVVAPCEGPAGIRAQAGWLCRARGRHRAVRRESEVGILAPFVSTRAYARGAQAKHPRPSEPGGQHDFTSFHFIRPNSLRRWIAPINVPPQQLHAKSGSQPIYPNQLAVLFPSTWAKLTGWRSCRPGS